MNIFSHHGSQWEGWLYLSDNGELIYHFENDGHQALRHGLQPREEVLTLEQALKRFPEHAEKIKVVAQQ